MTFSELSLECKITKIKKKIQKRKWETAIYALKTL